MSLHLSQEYQRSILYHNKKEQCLPKIPILARGYTKLVGALFDNALVTYMNALVAQHERPRSHRMLLLPGRYRITPLLGSQSGVGDLGYT